MVQIAVVGAGPAGLYVADALNRKLPDACIDLIERLPTPLGLLRGGVAPDHQGTKNVARQLERVMSKPGVRFLGHVDVGDDVSFAELKAAYDVVVISVGAPVDRRMDIPGEDLAGVYGSGAFVAWYNGQPVQRGQRGLDPLLDRRHIAVVGNGNVALDIVRLLGKSTAELADSDLCGQARDKWAAAAYTDIWLIGRRGPLEAGFTSPELAELGQLGRVGISLDASQLPLRVPADLPEERQKLLERNLVILRELAARDLTATRPLRLHILFNVAPLAVLGDARAERLRLERTRTDDGRCRMSGETFEIPADTVISAIGYRSAPLDGLPFDAQRGVVANQSGRVEPGVYATGWCKRGPQGVIPGNRSDSLAVAELILADLPQISPGSKPGGAELDRLLAERGVRTVDYAGWQRINAAEVSRGTAQGRPREKFTQVDEMLAAAVEGQGAGAGE